VFRAVLLAALACLPALARAQAPVSYRLSFPAPEHHWMQVEVAFAELPAAPLELRFSRASPGRYAAHEFARNLDAVRVTDDRGTPLRVTPSGTNGWNVPDHDGRVRVTYRVFGDWVDGTHLAVDSTHAHINMPAALMWARGLEERSAVVIFEPPAGRQWTVATQLMPGPDPLRFTAPNLQYLMDSPAEFSALTLRTFRVADGSRDTEFRVAVHHAQRNPDFAGLLDEAERIVRESRAIFGAFPAFDAGTYTFILDGLPWARGDGMEHRNSTVMTASAEASDPSTWRDLLAHEFLHAWNVERIRPRSLEPFNFESGNVASELWLAEGFNNYYGPLVQHRAGLISAEDFIDRMETAVNAVIESPGRRTRTLEDMSRLAPLVDGAARLDRSPDYTYLSYYTWGSAIGLALDLALRDRSEGRVSLDTFMRELWTRFGTSGETRPGYVERPYTIDDVQAALGAVSGDGTFARRFLGQYVQGHDVPDYRRLLGAAGFRVRPARPGSGYAGLPELDGRANGVRVAGSVAPDTPAGEAGLDRDDVLVAVGGRAVSGAGEVEAAIANTPPGSTLSLTFLRRGVTIQAQLRTVEDPRVEIVSEEAAGGTPTERQRRVRRGWLGAGR